MKPVSELYKTTPGKTEYITLREGDRMRGDGWPNCMMVQCDPCRMALINLDTGNRIKDSARVKISRDISEEEARSINPRIDQYEVLRGGSWVPVVRTTPASEPRGLRVGDWVNCGGGYNSIVIITRKDRGIVRAFTVNDGNYWTWGEIRSDSLRLTEEQAKIVLGPSAFGYEAASLIESKAELVSLLPDFTV